MLIAFKTIKINLIGYNPNSFSEPKSFNSAFKILTELIGNFSSEEFNKLFISKTQEKKKDTDLAAGEFVDTTINFSRYVAIQLMDDFVDKFDQSIKAITGTSDREYELTKKMANIQAMIRTHPISIAARPINPASGPNAPPVIQALPFWEMLMNDTIGVVPLTGKPKTFP